MIQIAFLAITIRGIIAVATDDKKMQQLLKTGTFVFAGPGGGRDIRLLGESLLGVIQRSISSG